VIEDPEQNRLLNGLVEGSLDAVETRRVRALLQGSAEARRDYYDLVAVEMLLAERYEMPDHIAMQAQVMADPAIFGGDRFYHSRRRLRAWAGGGIAALLALSWATFSFVESRQSDISVVVSPDSHYEVNGKVATSGILKAGDTIEVKHGAVSLRLSAHVDATLEGPVILKLGDREGRVDLISGSAFFTVSPGGHGLEVHSPAGIIRDIGTKFGVTVLSDGEVETHVDEGRVEIERQQGAKSTVTAGYSASWAATGAVTSRKISEYPYVRFLPDETPLLSDHFSDPDGTSLDGKAPKIGQRWKAERDSGNTEIHNGRLDTSGDPRAFSAGFVPQKEPGSVYLLTFSTRPSAVAANKEQDLDAEESVSLRDEDGKPLVSLVARASRRDSWSWQLKDGLTDKMSHGTRLLAFEDHTLTLSFDRRTGIVRLFEGSSTQGVFVDELKIAADKIPSSVCISSALGGDLSVDGIVVRMVTYQQ
jgi:hypothetical protein